MNNYLDMTEGKEESKFKQQDKQDISDILSVLEERQNELLTQIKQLNLMQIKTNARINELESRSTEEKSDSDISPKPNEFDELKSDVKELEKDLELISEFLLDNEENIDENDKDNSKIVKEHRDVEEEIEILNNKVEGVMDRLDTVLNIKHTDEMSENSESDINTSSNNLSNNAKTVLEKLKEMDEVSVDKLTKNTGMNREEIKTSYKELKQKGKV